MKRARANVTDAELEVLKALWEHGASTIRQLTDLLYPAGGTAHYATVQKLLERLEFKSYVRRRRRDRVNLYSATVDRQALIAHRLRETADRLCDGSLTPLLTHLVSSSRLSRDDVEELRRFVNRLDRRKSRG